MEGDGGDQGEKKQEKQDEDERGSHQGKVEAGTGAGTKFPDTMVEVPVASHVQREWGGSLGAGDGNGRDTEGAGLRATGLASAPSVPLGTQWDGFGASASSDATITDQIHASRI